MTEEKKREEDVVESQADAEEHSGAEEESETGGAELESMVDQGNEKLSQADARLVELEQLVAGRDGEITALKQAVGEMEARLAAVSQSLTEALASYKAAVVQANPEVIEELISGDSIATIDESLRQARALVSRVRQEVEAEISLAKVPAGAPERTSPDLSALSPREKIKYAIGGKS
ncbi:MAG: hypothetical protein U1B77_02175 [Dehalococcoidales bacterium]|nr:hypothetical protein [Dehalococcoidales bacterium]